MLSVSVTFEKNRKMSFVDLFSDESTLWREGVDMRLLGRCKEGVWCITTHRRSDWETGWGNRFKNRVDVSRNLPKASFYIEPHVFVELEYIE